jgi:hypothetical protein
MIKFRGTEEKNESKESLEEDKEDEEEKEDAATVSKRVKANG